MNFPLASAVSGKFWPKRPLNTQLTRVAASDDGEIKHARREGGGSMQTKLEGKGLEGLTSPFAHRLLYPLH